MRDVYERDGWALAPGLVDPGWLDRMRRHLAGLLATDPDGATRGFLAGAVVDDPEWTALVGCPALLVTARALLGAPIALFSSMYVVKPARTGRAVAWHQDGPDWPLDPVRAVTCGVALDVAGAGNGSLHVVPGSHRGGFRPHRADGASMFPVAVGLEAADEAAARAVPVGPGDVTFHHPALVHGSPANASDRPRTTFVVRYVPDDVRITADPWPSRMALG
jgi:phytanoyl-CoA hydroxylase